MTGRNEQCLPHQGRFKGVVLPPGARSVEFLYRNAAEGLGRRVSILILVVLVGLLVPGLAPRRYT